MDKLVLENAKVLWDYHLLNHDVDSRDFILVLGSHDTRVAEFAAKLFLDKKASLLITTGGFGKITRDIWGVTEGEKFARIAMSLGVPEENILVEDTASNTGDNFQKSRDLLREKKIEVASGTIVTKPYMCRRAFATGKKQWPEVDWVVTAPLISFEEYPNEEVPFNRMINLMVGDLQRIKVFAEKGFQIPQDVPREVWYSYNFLVRKGFDKFVIG
ncbi:MAG: YdcF family protein [Trueperaceae bacterium]|nr:YdcF family protein [Trueperaceae bacterium]